MASTSTVNGMTVNQFADFLADRFDEDVVNVMKYGALEQCFIFSNIITLYDIVCVCVIFGILIMRTILITKVPNNAHHL